MYRRTFQSPCQALPYLRLGLKRLLRRQLLNELRDSKRSGDSSTWNITSKTLFNAPPGACLRGPLRVKDPPMLLMKMENSQHIMACIISSNGMLMMNRNFICFTINSCMQIEKMHTNINCISYFIRPGLEPRTLFSFIFRFPWSSPPFHHYSR